MNGNKVGSGGHALSRYGPRPLIAIGIALLAAGMSLLARVPTDGTYWRDVLPPLLLLAIGSGISYAPIFIAGTTGVADHDQGLASGFLNSAQELGAAAAVTTLSMLLVAGIPPTLKSSTSRASIA